MKVQSVSQAALFLLTALTFHATIHGSFTADDVNGTYILRFGFNLCPAQIQFDLPPFPDMPPSSILVNEKVCTDGQLETFVNAGEEDRPDPLARYIRAEAEAGGFIRADVVRSLECPDFKLNERGYFNFIKADGNFSVSWLRVFGRNDTELSLANGDGYTFVNNVSHVIINSLCLFTRFNALDVEVSEDRVCFPAGGMVTLSDGRGARLDSLSTGDMVRGRDGEMTEIIGWTHRDGGYEGWYVRIEGEDGVEVRLTRGHYIYVNDGMMVAEEVKKGDWIWKEEGWRERVREVGYVRDVGLFNAQTLSGDIVVDGVLCSTYTRSTGPIVGHALLAPVRLGRLVNVDLLSFFLFLPTWLTWSSVIAVSM